MDGDQIIGSLVKSPLDYYLQLMSVLQLNTPLYTANAESIHQLFSTVYYYAQSAGMPIFRPQSVNGYSGYSSSPNYDKNWITTSTLRVRFYNSIDMLISGFTKNGFLYKLNLPSFVKDSGNFSNPGNSDQLVQEFFSLLHIEIPGTARFTYFRDIFLGGLSPTNWQNEWNNYVNTGTATAVKIPIDRLVKALVKSPEYQVL